MRPPRDLVLTWISLAALVACNIALAFLLPERLALGINLGMAALIGAMLMIFFMELRTPVSLTWVFAGAGFFWLAIFFTLIAADYLTRYSFAPV